MEYTYIEESQPFTRQEFEFLLKRAKEKLKLNDNIIKEECIRDGINIVADWMVLQEEWSPGTMRVPTEEWERMQRILFSILRDFYPPE